ncbi:MAG: hypothetical protein WCO19_03285 [Candidatus Saccharibacteria bacterium]
MFRDAKDFLDRRTAEAEVDISEYRKLLRWLTFVATTGDHYTIYAQKDLPQATWHERRHEDDVFLGYNAFPYRPEKGGTHIQLFSEGHPVYSPLGISAIVGANAAEGGIDLCILSTDGDKAWANRYRGGDPVGNEAFLQLVSNLHDIQI